MTTVNDNPSNGTSPSETARRGQASWRTTAAAAFLGLALVGGLVVVLSGGDHDNGTGTAGAAAPAAAAPADPAADGAAEAGPAAPAKSVLGDATWELVSGRAVPSSPTAGPTKINGPVHAGFAHTQDGAVLAALNIYARYTLTPGNGWLDVARAQVEPGKGREVYIEARKTLATVEAPAGGWGQTAGFRVVSYSKDKAVVEEAMRFSSGSMQVQTLTVIWRTGDWRLVLLPDGNASPPVIPLAGLDGFTPLTGGI